MTNSVEAERRCGIVMPIGDTEGYPTGHWSDILEVLQAAAQKAGLRAGLVSDSEGINIIHKSIVQNLYFDDLIICDVSSRNSNVMIELGLRLAFDKPVIIVKDDATRYPFDTSSLEYIEYRKDLRYKNIGAFTDRLTRKIEGVLSDVDKGTFHSFLKTFGDFKSPDLTEKVVPVQDFIIDNIKSLQLSVEKIGAQLQPATRNTEVRIDVAGRGHASMWFKLDINAVSAVANILASLQKEFPKIDMKTARDGSEFLLGADLRKASNEEVRQFTDRVYYLDSL